MTTRREHSQTNGLSTHGCSSIRIVSRQDASYARAERSGRLLRTVARTATGANGRRRASSGCWPTLIVGNT